MDYAKFQVAVMELAGDGVRLTVANVVAELRVTPKVAEQLLDRMAKDGLADLDVDESEGVIVYRMLGLTPKRASSSISVASLRDAAIGRVVADRIGAATGLGRSSRDGARPLAASARRSVPLGIVLAGLFPGFGLAYTAPWPVVAVAAIAAVIAGKILAFLPFFLSTPLVLVAVIASAVVGGLYTWQYNQTGRRTSLTDEAVGPKRLPFRIKF